jgi:hypothetical protein
MTCRRSITTSCSRNPSRQRTGGKNGTSLNSPKRSHDHESGIGPVPPMARYDGVTYPQRVPRAARRGRHTQNGILENFSTTILGNPRFLGGAARHARRQWNTLGNTEEFTGGRVSSPAAAAGDSRLQTSRAAMEPCRFFDNSALFVVGGGAVMVGFADLHSTLAPPSLYLGCTLAVPWHYLWCTLAAPLCTRLKSRK